MGQQLLEVKSSSRMLVSLQIFIFLIVTIQGTPIGVPQQPGADVARQLKAEEMLQYMNTSVDPCENFYEYACGNYGKYHKASLHSLGSVGPLELLAKAMDAKTMSELQIDNSTDTEWDKIVKNFYRSCTAAPDMDDVYPQRLKEVIEEVGQMPALNGDNWKNFDFDWLETIAKIESNTFEQIIIGAYVIPDFLDNTKNAGLLAAPSLSLEKKAFYVNEKMRKVSHLFVHPIAKKLHKYLGMDDQLANETAQEIFDFEVKLAECLPDDKDNSKLLDTYVAMTIDEVQAEYLEYWDTKKFFTIVYGFVPDVVYVERKYMNSLREVLKKTPNRVLANYIFYTYANYFIYRSGDNQDEINSNCLKVTKMFFYKNINNLMYRRLFTEFMKDGIYSIWHDIKAAFEKLVASPRMDWINDETRHQTIDKLSHMGMQINSYEDEDFAKQMGGMHVLATNDYVANIKSVYQHLGDWARMKANQPPESIETGYMATFTPLYHKLENKVHVPVSLLMPFHFWSDSYPQAYNFASLGFYLAHEVLHGFDDDGRLFDKNGNSHTWWDTKSMDEFSKRKQCFVKQYANFTYNESPLGELDAQDENIADNGGVRLAYEAYLHWYANSMNDDQQMQMETLPGFKYTPRQLFFVSYGQLFCYNADARIQIIQKMIDTHMPDPIRVIGPLSNLEEFHKEFHCPKGSAMNPAIRCEIY